MTVLRGVWTWTGPSYGNSLISDKRLSRSHASGGLGSAEKMLTIESPAKWLVSSGRVTADRKEKVQFQNASITITIYQLSSVSRLYWQENLSTIGKGVSEDQECGLSLDLKPV